ncbi:hypothetical protein [Pedobacter roseus]|uniref:Uncharacterized protein n=1 Tax=Pedobacter roseus TaxID=336820 RepID=A0A7G9QGY6_9SPHI|nr:hypothetical protein [Pedobacter roseus]QNN42611.1 hypothetical protein H9L23_00385 [Pedobacter roseus]
MKNNITMDNEIMELFTKFVEKRQSPEETLKVTNLLNLGKNIKEWQVVIGNMNDVCVVNRVLTEYRTRKIFNKISGRVKNRGIKKLHIPN